MWTCARGISPSFGRHPVFDTKCHDPIISCWGFHELINNNNNTPLTTVGMQIIISTLVYLSTQRIRCSDWSPGPVWTMWKLLTGVSPYNGQFDVVALISQIFLPGGFVWEFFLVGIFFAWSEGLWTGTGVHVLFDCILFWFSVPLQPPRLAHKRRCGVFASICSISENFEQENHHLRCASRTTETLLPTWYSRLPRWEIHFGKDFLSF